MFYTDIIAYSRLPSKSEIQSLKEQGYNVAIIVDEKISSDYLKLGLIEIKWN